LNIHIPQQRALLLLGCPEVPVQTSLAIYTSNLLTNSGAQVVIAGNNAVLELIRTADPTSYYVKDMVDVDTIIGSLAQKTEDFDICYVFIHNDAGVSYLATVNALISGQTVGIIFGNNAHAMAQQCADAGLKNIWAKAVHNPKPLKPKIAMEVKRWAALTR
jgi:hypothetical protein